MSGSDILRFSLLIACAPLAACETAASDTAAHSSQNVLSDSQNAPGIQTVAEKCGGDFTLAPGRAGAIAIGMPVDSLRTLCAILSEIPVSTYGSTLLIARVGSDSARIWTRDGKVEWLDITSPQYRTADDVGAGSSVEAILKHESLAGGFGDGFDTFVLHTTSGPLCGMSFRVDTATATAMLQFTKNRLDSSELRRALASTGTSARVTAVWVQTPTRCN